MTVRRDLRYKLLFVVAVAALLAWGFIPPREKIRLGLDLKGGIHLVLRVEADDAVRAVLDNRASTLETELRARSLRFTDVQPDMETPGVVVLQPDNVARDEFLRTIQSELPGYQVADEGGNLRVSLPAEEVERIKEDAINDTLERIRTRVDAFGVAEAAVQRQGLQSSRILIQLPGVDDPERVKDLVAKPAFLEWKGVVLPPGTEGNLFPGAESREAVVQMFGGQLPAGTEIYESDPNTSGGRVVYWPLTQNSPVSGNDLITARTGRGELGSAEVQFTLTPEAGARFERFTGANIGRQLAALLDKRVVQVATIQSSIRENGRITNMKTLQEADDLALKLRSGALPARTTVLEERTVGPSLGADSIRQGVIASVAGLAASILFMLIYYKMSGVNAVIALLLNVIILLGAMSWIGATLTLPGIAGIILTFGMALDANVLIFERIREELRLGKTVRAAVDAGFQKAFWTIFDSNLTTVIAAILLFQFGTGPVRGFAFTLIIGLAASMFTAIFVSRLLFQTTLGEGVRVERLSI
ncbi:MAG TPA: protein translocase subunit SecD [Candidatus Polarisedimenticolia bacterium]|nr:protein translocase subunit SecD [Candidatus Polarisedimenticolia bacterium]